MARRVSAAELDLVTQGAERAVRAIAAAPEALVIVGRAPERATLAPAATQARVTPVEVPQWATRRGEAVAHSAE
ncbi:MAG: hypothetical protein ACJ79J_13130 [Gemmatimonadaceae bacterium]